MANAPEVLDSAVVSQQGSFHVVRRYYRGKHPTLGTLVFGWTGWETVQDVTVVIPAHVVTVTEDVP